MHGRTRIPRNFCNTKRLPEQQTKRNVVIADTPHRVRIEYLENDIIIHFLKQNKKLFAKEKRRYLRRLGIKSDSAESTETRLEIT